MEPAITAPTPVIRLDKSRPFQTIHGDRIPEDPHYRVHFFQNGLPFDASGIIVSDDGKTEPYEGLVEGIKTIFRPLYTEKMRETVKLKLARMQRAPVAGPAQTEEDIEQERRGAAAMAEVYAAVEDVNLESWLRGNIQYEAFMIFDAVMRRYHKKHMKIRSVVEDLVLEERLVPESDVAPHLMKLLNQAA